ncbi:MAG: hypothetical protein ACPGJS_15805, partial [Flammeovirgaceae bacterium]
VPAIIHGSGKIFSLDFDSEGKYLIFSDEEAVRARIIDAKILYTKLKELTNGKELTPEQEEIYVGLTDE